MGLGYSDSRVFAILLFVFLSLFSPFPTFLSSNLNFFFAFFSPLWFLSSFSILGYLKEARDIPRTAFKCLCYFPK